MQVRSARLIALSLFPAFCAAAFSQTPVSSDDRIPNGNWVFGSTESLYVLTSPTSPTLRKLNPINGSTIESYVVTGHEALFGGLASDDAGDLYSIDGYNDANPDRLFRIDRGSGAGTVVGDTGFNWNFRFVYVHPITDVLYGARDNRLFTMDKTTGAATLIATMTGSTLDQTTAMAIDRSGRAYITDIGDTGLFELDLQTGQATHLGNLRQGERVWFNDLAFDSSGVLHGAWRDGVYTIDIDAVQATRKFGGVYVGLTFYGDTGDCDPCDMNCDGSVDAFDIEPFLGILFEGDVPCDTCTGDANGDGVVDAFDIEPFLNCLFP